MLEMLGRSSNQFSTRHTGPGCLRAPLLILSPSACATVAHLFPSSSLPRTRKDGARDAGFPSSSLPRIGLCNYVELIDPTFRDAGGVD